MSAPVINLLVEGVLDEAVGRRLAMHHGATVGVVFGKRGYGYIRDKVQSFARSSAGVPLMALVDLMDTGYSCAPSVVSNWLPHLPASMLFRIVVREIDSWVMADREGIASHLSVALGSIPAYPDELSDPKRTLIEIAKRSRSSTIRSGIPPISSAATTGVRYNPILVGFVRDSWNLRAAEMVSPSLHRASAALSQLLRQAS